MPKDNETGIEIAKKVRSLGGKTQPINALMNTSA